MLRDTCIGLVGPLPPRRGGISLYVQRLAVRLAARGARVVVLSTNGGTEVAPGIAVRKVADGRQLAASCGRVAWNEGVDLLHFHTFGAHWKEMLPFVALRQVSGLPIVVSQHSFIRDVAALTAADRRMLAWCIQAVSRVATSGPTVHGKLLHVGAPPEQLVPLVPFLAPSPAELHGAPWPENVAAVRARSAWLVASGTGRLDAVRGRDLYGLDQFVRAARLVLQQRPDAGFVYLIAAAGDAGLFDSAASYVQEHGLQDRICIHVGDLPGPQMWQAADIFVRPTLDDGDAVSIREAMHLGVPAVASDVVGRPPGCRTYRGGDPEDLARVILEMASDLPSSRALVAAHPPQEAVDTLIEVYRQALRDRSRRDRWTWNLLHWLRSPFAAGDVPHA